MRNSVAQHISRLGKQSVAFLLLIVIIGGLGVYIYAQREYTIIREKERETHWKIVQELRQQILAIANQTQTMSSLAEFVEDDDIRQTIAEVFHTAPHLSRVSLLDVDGNLLFGKEAASMSDYFQSLAAPSQPGSSANRHSRQFALFQMSPYVVQLPLSIHQQQIGFLRGEFFPMESGTTLAYITRLTLQTTIIATILMVVFGGVLMFSQITKHLSTRRQQLEAYVLSLEKANEELQRTKKELQLSEKLASLGYLAAGIAHEIGNPLGAALGYIELLQKQSLESEKARDVLQRTEREIARIREILQGLVNFSRPHALHLQIVDMNPLIRKVVSQLPSLPEKTIDIQLKLTEFPLFAEVDPHKLQSVFFNILCNAIDAITTSGHIQIATSRRIRESAAMIGGSEVIAIQFSDTGSGISEEHLARVFEPFFTTKDPGKGMGLGLSLCHRIIETLNGEMEIHSVYGKGTDVMIFLPPAKKKRAEI